MFGLGGGEVILLFIFALIFIGPKKLPELARSLGKGLREFQKARQDFMEEIHKSAAQPSTNMKAAPPKSSEPEAAESAEVVAAKAKAPEPELEMEKGQEKGV